jgi:hypothetical protein
LRQFVRRFVRYSDCNFQVLPSSLEAFGSPVAEISELSVGANDRMGPDRLLHRDGDSLLLRGLVRSKRSNAGAREREAEVRSTGYWNRSCRPGVFSSVVSVPIWSSAPCNRQRLKISLCIGRVSSLLYS